MQVPIKHLLEIANLDQMRIPIDISSLEKTLAYTVEDGEVIKHNFLTANYGIQLLKKQIDKINIIPNREMLQEILDSLRIRHSADYPKPTGSFTLRELMTLTVQFEEMNNYSDKKREIYVLHEIATKPHPVTQKQQVLYQYNTRLNPKIVERLQSVISESEKLDCLETEHGILIVTISKDQTDTLNTIMAATDLVARLEKHFKLDLAYSVQEAIERFRAFQPRLVVFGNYKVKSETGAEEINEKARYSYLELRNYDIFMKSLFINQVNLEENREKLAGEIMAAYRLPYTFTKAESKAPLPDEEKKKILNQLDKLNKCFTREEYLKLSVQLKILEQTNLVPFLKSQLVNINKLHSGPK